MMEHLSLCFQQEFSASDICEGEEGQHSFMLVSMKGGPVFPRLQYSEDADDKIAKQLLYLIFHAPNLRTLNLQF